MSWPDFAVNPHNIRVGFSPWWGKPIWWSIFKSFYMASPIFELQFIALVDLTKWFFVMLVLLILRKECVKNENIDVYTTIGWRITRAMERGEHIWCDKAKRQVLVEGHLHVEFTWLPYIWFICKLPFTKGYLACPICGPKVDTRHSSQKKKTMYLRHWRYLAKGHSYMKDCVAFNGQTENMSGPPKVSATKFLRNVEECKAWLDRRSNASEDRNDLIHIHGVKKKNIFFFAILVGMCFIHKCSKMLNFHSIMSMELHSFFSDLKTNLHNHFSWILTWIYLGLFCSHVFVVKILLPSPTLV
jgi:hypothetical protein